MPPTQVPVEVAAALVETGRSALRTGFAPDATLLLDRVAVSAVSPDAQEVLQSWRGGVVCAVAEDAEVVFADSDRAHLEPGNPVAERLAEWKVKAPESSYEIKKYQDVFLYLTRFPGKPMLEGQLVQLSVAPTSVKIYTRACLTAKGRGRAPHETVFKIGVGEKIRGEFDYYPWSFECIGSCQKLGVEVKFGAEVDENF